MQTGYLKRIFLCLPLVAVLCAFTPQQKKDKKKEPSGALAPTDYRQLGAPLPPVRLITTTGAVYTNDSLNGTGNLFVMFFNPTCEHCEAMTDALIADGSKLASSKVVLVAGNMMLPYLKDFEHSHKLNDYPQIPVAVDSAMLIEKVYNYQNLPQINVYNSDRKLIGVYSGITTTDSLRQYMR